MRGFTLGMAMLVGCGPTDRDGDGFEASVDCDDADASRNPLAPEVCDGVDNDCDGAVDDDAVDAEVFVYADRDGDGIGDEDAFAIGCGPTPGFVLVAGDCDDLDETAYPGADERCDGVDNDCDTAIDEDAVDAVTWFRDGDGDGAGDLLASTTSCGRPEGYVADASDCDDTDGAVSPDADERCNGLDDDCDDAIDEDAVDFVPSYTDEDGDGYGPDASETLACDVPGGRVADGGDCDDDDASRSPGAPEACDGVDNDCDSQIDPFTVPSGFPTLTAAVNAATEGSEVCVEPGTYGDPIDVTARSVRLVGLGGASTTILELGSDTLIAGDSTTDLEVRGFTVTGASVGADPIGRFIELEDAGSTSEGGRLVLDDVHFLDIDAQFGAGARGGLLSVDRADAALRNVRLTNVELSTSADNLAIITGGLLYHFWGALQVDGLAIEQSAIAVQGDTDCELRGGWLLHIGQPLDPSSTAVIDDLTVDDVTISATCGRQAAVDGGIVDLTTRDGTGARWTLRDIDLTVTANEIDGGSLVVLGRDLTLDGLTLVDSSVALDSAALGNPQGMIRASERLAVDHLTAFGNRLAVTTTGNNVTRGGLISGPFGTDIALRWLDVRGNTLAVDDGLTGGLIYHNGSLSIANGILAGNTVGTPGSTSILGGLIFSDLDSTATLDLDNVDIYANAVTSGATLSGALLWVDDFDSSSGVRVASSSLADNPVDPPGSNVVQFAGTACTWSYGNLFPPGAADSCDSSTGLISVAPGYRDVSGPDPRTWDLTLDPESDLVDAGDPAVTDADGTPTDIGAHGGPGGDGWTGAP